MQKVNKKQIRKNRNAIILAVLLAMLFLAIGTFNSVSQANFIAVPRDTYAPADGDQTASVSSGDAQPGAASATNPDGVSGADLVSDADNRAGEQIGFDALTVTADSANIRSGPGADYDLVSEAVKDEQYDVLGIENAENGVPWYKIALGEDAFGEEQTGYVCGSYISYTGRISGGKVYLTFDDGPSENTGKILDILDSYGVKATFFVIHEPEYSDMYGEILRRGHTLGLHSYSHRYKTVYSSEEAFFTDLEKISDYVFDQTGFYAEYIRFPGGSSNTISRKYSKGIMTRLTEEVELRGYKYFDWNVSCGDADGENVPADKLVSLTKSGSGNLIEITLLLHDAAAKATTVDALPRIIEYYQSRGYQLCAITDDTEPSHHKINN